ncbi:hypothetical protein BSK48_24165 [Paenibacillus odorifer]|nr:hypothetical protein BSK48_24165 [Paenibacillus odorifer]
MQEARSKKQEARSKKQEARSKKQEARSKKQGARSKKQEARSKEQEARSKEQEAAEGFRTDHGYTINVPSGVLLHHNSYLSFSELEEQLATRNSHLASRVQLIHS